MAERWLHGELADGEFRRQASRFRGWIGEDPREPGRPALPVQAGRYHLYVALACPWSHRTVILRELAGLAEAVPIHFLAPFRDERGWAFTGERFDEGPGGSYADPLHAWEYLSEAYLASDPSFHGRITVPVLWDERERRIVNNESGDIVRMMATAGSLGSLGTPRAGDLCPPALMEEMEAVNSRVYETVNNGVYRAGFAGRQEAYERAFREVFGSLAWLEELLGRRRYLLGEQTTEADWRLFPTLVRFDEVYNLHFRLNRRRIVDHPNLWGYARELYQQEGIARTVAMGQIKVHYYTTHDELNPKRIIPVGPGYDWLEPHGRGS